ncbi:carbohydrate ABC transporter permease [Paenibacillus sacheonensis]|uniref:ABC transporter permease subunit n=1 Tax=Paenibacillus sacheonensis TaxID=742054 RepID=A0A7X5C129_9BACL|nr:carbohydrate ABC transporter permease [Paenibacillus sacheonensis]MBM7568521.1 putative aldouronate transport system permease protein [Paenibacillus sacheonensis]NBC72347.1 ABC transporter permease subunit [Paenibacillus sacheonensis]
MIHSKADRIYQIVIHIIVIAIVVSAIFPLIYVLGMSLTGQTEMMERNYFVIIPHEPTLSSYERILSSPLIWKSFFVSVFRSAAGTLLMLALTVVGAYVLSVRTLPGRSVMLFLVLGTILFNAGLIPTYLVVKKLGFVDSIWVLILLYLVDSFGLLVIKIFIENLPDGLIEAGKIDGAGDIQMLLRVVVPLAAPALAAIGLFSIVFHWNSWFDAMVYLNNASLFPMQLILKNMLTAASGDMMSTFLSNTAGVTPESMKMATVIVGTLPILLVYPFLQKHFVKGVYLGAVKG